jgi:hypothetical protein
MERSASLEPYKPYLTEGHARTRQGRADYTQAMTVAIGFYLVGHLADLATTVAFVQLGRPECNYIPALVLQHGGLFGLIGLKLFGMAATGLVLWKLRSRLFTILFTSMLALFLIYVASVNSLDVLAGLQAAQPWG